jgi:hypothetical protein
MAVRGFFYNSVNKDRLYNGQDMNEDKAPFYKEGVAYGHLQVTADGESMAVKPYRVRIHQLAHNP